MLCLGIDPDMHDTAIASWDDAGPVAAHVVSVPRKLTGTDALLAMMHELSKPWPDFWRPIPPGTAGTMTISAPNQPSLTLRYDQSELPMPDWCAVEGQELARTGPKRHARPEDIVRLGNVAGMCVMRVARGYLHGCGLYWPKPSEWKGSVEKHAMQARLYEELGWGYEIVYKNQKSPLGRSRKGDYAIPAIITGSEEHPFEHIERAQWKHVGDALLLARWCWEQASGKVWAP